MVCSKCNSNGTLNHANGKEFYYCKNCKIEIVLEENPTAEKDADLTQQEIDEIFNDFGWAYKPSMRSEEYEQECLSDSPHWSDKE